MSGFALFWLLNLLLRSPGGILLLAILAFWYLDNRYLGWLAALWAPVARAQRIAALRQAVEINPSDVRAMVELGEHYLLAGRPQTAADYLQRAGRLCAAAGRKDLAQPLFAEAVQNWRFTPRLMRRRARRWLVRAKLGLLQCR
jgi:cytochrome c-type biogenesis protein CcmH/NrfG